MSTTDGYCCLGVACAISGLDIDKTGCNSYIPFNWEIPDALKGVPTQNEIVKTLTYMNDGDKLNGTPAKSFEEIADYIEQNL